jgi:hypothetical protein
MISVNRGRFLVLAVIVITLLGGLLFVALPILPAPRVLDIARAIQQCVAALLLTASPSVSVFLAAQRKAFASRPAG